MLPTAPNFRRLLRHDSAAPRIQYFMTGLGETLNRIQETSFEFLITDLDLGLTLCRIASDAGDDSEKRNRNRQNARKAYESILGFSEKLHLTEEQDRELKDKLRELRTSLEKLDEAAGRVD